MESRMLEDRCLVCGEDVPWGDAGAVGDGWVIAADCIEDLECDRCHAHAWPDIEPVIVVDAKAEPVAASSTASRETLIVHEGCAWPGDRLLGEIGG